MKKFSVVLVVAMLLSLAHLVLAAPAPLPPDVQAEIDEINAKAAVATKAAADLEALKAQLLAKYGITVTPAPAPAAPTVVAGSAGSQIKIDGRIFTGVLASGKNGPTPDAVLAIPDAKLRFTWMPSRDVTVVTRLSESTVLSATSAKPVTGTAFDYFYVDLNNWDGALPGNTLRLGKMKADVGEETWTDNPEESILITNSAGIVNGYDGGMDFRGALGQKGLYSLSLLNGTGTVTTTGHSVAYAAKLGTALPGGFYVSGTYFNSGDLGSNNSGITVGGLNAMPTGAAKWSRNLWEADARWNYGKTGIKPTIGSPVTTRWQAAGACGQFNDDATGAPSRDGKFWYVETLYNACSKAYLSARYSRIGLNDGYLDNLGNNPLGSTAIAVDAYRRLGLGVGLRLTPLTQIKAEYTFNNTTGGLTTPDLNQFAIGVASKF